jgi:hypothetical protein
MVSLDHAQLPVTQQALGSTAEPSSPPSFPHDGLMCFAGILGSASNATPWFQNLCGQGSLDECRFGLAFDPYNTCLQYFGIVEHDQFTGELSVAPIVIYPFGANEWAFSRGIQRHCEAINYGRYFVIGWLRAVWRILCP